MARAYHIAAVGGSHENEVSVVLADVLNALGAQDRDLRAAIPLTATTRCCGGAAILGGSPTIVFPHVDYDVRPVPTRPCR